MSRARATWDHVVPRCRGGHTRWDNVVLACRTCNQKKGGKTPEEAGMKLHCRPTKPNGLGSLLDSSLSYREPMPSHWRTYLG
jgi:5-methylcytosine-specific restriction endonuclease McrA